MPTEITRPSVPIAQRVGTPGPGSRDVTPLSLTALAIIAILVLSSISPPAPCSVTRTRMRRSRCAGRRSELHGGCEAAGVVTAVRLADPRGASGCRIWRPICC